MIFGGKKYKRELARMSQYVRIINELARAGKVIELEGREVDLSAERLKVKVPDHAFNGEHLVAILLVSGCRVVCTDDKRAHPYLKRSDLYPPGKRPQIYSRKSHSFMCGGSNITEICQ
jgi:hypothetical protein